MSIEAFHRSIKEVKALTSQERPELISNLDTGDKEITADATALWEWLIKAGNTRAELPPTQDSVNILRELREDRSR